MPAQPGPCSHSDVTLTDSPPDNSIHAPPASCQSQRPSWGYWRSCQPVWDVSVKAHPLCHSVSRPGQPDVRLLSSFHLSFLSTSVSFFLWQSVCLLSASHQGYDSPLIPDPITDFLDTHLSSLNPLVFVMECFTNTSTDLIYMFLCLQPFFMPPYFLSFLCVSLSAILLCSFTLHLSLRQLTRSGPPADWKIGRLSYLSILFYSCAKLDQARTVDLLIWPKSQSFCGKMRGNSWNSASRAPPTALWIWIIPEASSCQTF